MIEIKNVYKRYHHRKLQTDWVLRDINLTIPPKVSVGLLGRNGAGKSTLLRLIAGMDSPERGEIIRNCRVSWPIGLSGGFQGSMTGRQNVKFVARVHGGDKKLADITRRVEDFAEIGPAFDQPINTYSSGMRARLAFGLSLAFDFDVYLSDEATAVGDRQFRAKATQAFKERVDQSSLIMVSHSEGILKDLCQAGMVIDQGGALWFDDINTAIKYYHTLTGGESKKAKPKKTLPPGAELSAVADRKKTTTGKASKASTVHLSPRNSDERNRWVKALKQSLERSEQQLEIAISLEFPLVEIKEQQRRIQQDRKKLESLVNTESEQQIQKVALKDLNKELRNK